MKRCPHCGGKPATWSTEKVLDAARAYHARYRVAPTAEAWRRSSPKNPASTTVRALFGTWNEMIRQAGFKPRPAHAPPPETVWSRDQVTQLIYLFRFTHGRLPSWRDWKTADPYRPTSNQVTRLFGSWNAAMVAAGYEHEARGSGGRTRAGYQRQAGAATRLREAVL